MNNTLWISLGAGVILLIVLFMFGGPIYGVWEQGQAGKAELAKADYNRQVQVVTAQANLEAEKLNAQSEVIRAQGVAQANVAVKDSINEQYIRYLWVKTLDNSSNKELIYIPTEANLPITEATRLQQGATKP